MKIVSFAGWGLALSLVAMISVNGFAATNMCLIPAGSFEMGDNYDEGSSDECPVHTVYVSAFYMDKYEVTKALWDEVYSWATNNGYSFDKAGSGSGTNHPVHTLKWYDCVKWCNARSEKEGVTPCYYTSSEQTTVYKTGSQDLSSDSVNWSTNGYRLPTEAEWEKAARGGLSGHHFPWNSSGGSYSDHIGGSNANYSGSGDPYDNGTTPVGYYNGSQTPSGSDMANGYGLYDMSGNVWEWCYDWYSSSYYSSSPDSDPTGPTSSSPWYKSRVLRGGSWYYYSCLLRCANRYHCHSANILNITTGLIGFRCAKGL